MLKVVKTAPHNYAIVRDGNLLGTIRKLPGGIWATENPHHSTNAFREGWDALMWVCNPISLRKAYVNS